MCLSFIIIIFYIFFFYYLIYLALSLTFKEKNKSNAKNILRLAGGLWRAHSSGE